VARLGIRSVWMTGHPVGLRRNTGQTLTDRMPATRLPREAAEQVAAALDRASHR
jgi:hypothetical protein